MNSSVLKWPDVATVKAAVVDWATTMAERRPDIVSVGYFGSYARGDWGMGSDLDLIVIVAKDTRPFWQRPGDFDLAPLPVPADLLVYTLKEWENMGKQKTWFWETVQREAVWVFNAR